MPGRKTPVAMGHKDAERLRARSVSYRMKPVACYARTTLPLWWKAIDMSRSQAVFSNS
jgi:hypothetical protein